MNYATDECVGTYVIASTMQWMNAMEHMFQRIADAMDECDDIWHRINYAMEHRSSHQLCDGAYGIASAMRWMNAMEHMASHQLCDG